MQKDMPRKTFWTQLLPWRRKKYLQARVEALKAHGIYPEPNHWLFDGIAAAEKAIQNQKRQAHFTTRLNQIFKNKNPKVFR